MISTDSFTVQDVVRLVNVLILRYNLIVSLRKIKEKENRYRIYIHSQSMSTLKDIVLPYMEDSMLYKINNLSK